MAKYKIEINLEECIGCGACAATCSDSFEMKDDTKAHPINSDVEDIGCAMDAAQTCPVTCIHITDTKEDKKLI